MRRTVLHMMMSLDGYVASADASESWMVAPDHDRDAASLEVANQADTAIVGHGVYHDMVGYWPTAEGETPTQRAYIERINPLPKLVVTHEPVVLEWNATSFVVTDDLTRRITELKAGDGGDIVDWGGADFARQLALRGLIDEYQLIVQPVTLGSGSALFGNTEQWRQLRMLATRAFRTGAVLLRYAYEPEGGSE